MPIYSYRCNSCHAEFDRLVRSETKVACPACQGRKLERLMSLTARPASGGKQADSFGKPGTDLSRLGPPPGGGCCGGGCHTHGH
jgi:putative FmdB family regulatory protein